MNSKMVLVVFSVLTATVLTADFVVGMDNATTFTHPITYLGTDIFGEYWIFFQDGTYYKYSANLASVEVFSIGIAVQEHTLKNPIATITLANGTSFSTTKSFSVFMGDSKSKVLIREYPSDAELQNILVGVGEILDNWVGSFEISGKIIPWTILILSSNSVVLHYDGNVHVLDTADIIQDFKGGVCYKSHFNTNSDLFEVWVDCLISNVAYIRKCEFHLTFTFNHATNQFDYTTHTSTISNYFWAPNTLIFFQKAGDLVFMEDAQAATPYIVYIPDDTAHGMAPLSEGNTTSQFFRYLDGVYYGFHANGLAKLKFWTASKVLQFEYLTSPLPRSSYGVAFSTGSHILYQPGTNKIYPSVQSIPIPSITAQTDKSSSPRIKIFKNAMLTNLFNTFSSTAQEAGSAPAGRRVASPLFYFFGVFDDLFLFQFHDRTYGDTMNEVFAQTNLIEYAKWSLLDYKKIFDFFGFSVTRYRNVTEYQNEYQTYPFATANHTEVEPQGLMTNCHNFFIVAIPLTLLLFFAGKGVFTLTFDYPISKFFRKFHFGAYFIIVLFDGNVQQFAFHMASEWQNLFFFAFPQKMLKILAILFGFFLVLGSVAFYAVCYTHYRKLNRVLTDNNYNILKGYFLLIAQVGFRNFLLGLLNSVLRGMQYEAMLGIILGVDLLFLLTFAASISCRVYRQNLKMWIYVLLNFLKNVLVLTLFFDYGTVDTPVVEYSQQMILMLILLVFLFGIGVETVTVIGESIHIIKSLDCWKRETGLKNKKKKERKTPFSSKPGRAPLQNQKNQKGAKMRPLSKPQGKADSKLNKIIETSKKNEKSLPSQKKSNFNPHILPNSSKQKDQRLKIIGRDGNNIPEDEQLDKRTLNYGSSPQKSNQNPTTREVKSGKQARGQLLYQEKKSKDSKGSSQTHREKRKNEKH